MIPSNPVLLLSFLMYCFLEISIKAQNLYFTSKQGITSSWVTLFLIGLWFIAVSGVFYISNFFITVGLSCVCLKNNTCCIHVSLNLSRKTHKWVVSAPILFIHFLPRFKSNSPLQLLYIPWKLARRICWLVTITSSSW